MSNKITPKLPLLEDKAQPGFELIDNVKDLVRQNLKMVILTSPGERVMVPDFGVGVRGLLFENIADQETLSFFKGRIKDQVKKYLPFVELEEVTFFEKDIDVNKVSLLIRYTIPSLGLQEVLEV
tara:strand:- start:776 stop:1147 length:372 start_codon:yes stop_codon:yes gene_type:complete